MDLAVQEVEVSHKASRYNLVKSEVCGVFDEFDFIRNYFVGTSTSKGQTTF